jgi:hypothetical protein
MEKCPACGVIIEDGVAKFSYGKPGDLEFLAQRVCQYRKVDSPCINPCFNEEHDYPPGYDEAPNFNVPL